ncbi:pyridoxamine 5'-phosphate oxidase [Sandaracinobacteroides saxicola]|uniref:Pyridoxine/pyridoxamine 5'-phosphate oxidase n=1 Tax=Sandaracinobacteroides saxicola TaxID=2759707 RepID=A0A7G5IFB4_9SPHN|nr:pyridoxamine 5'-phosphate oxidase [Sandaracinobacteroides saxicola]QMW22056.1 pyridoxamine 5'-phosphate oxidase [Sandaracinobacteroides saxicola]
MTDPFARFADWFAAATAAEANDPNACALATVDAAGRPDVRIVLMKEWDRQGFVFYTNRQSAKGRQLAHTPYATLDFHWKSLRRQLRISGAVTPVDAAQSDAYFATRPRESQLSAWASLQSEPLADRETFESRLAETAARFPDAVPRPPHWGGYRVTPDWFEFWEDRLGRQHHRERFDRAGDGWQLRLLYP